MNVGYIGLGAMGGSLARHLVSDHPLVVYDLNPASAAALKQCGAAVAESPRELARSADVVVLCLPRSADVERVLFGTDGIAADLRPGTLVIDQTSGVPEMTAGFARRVAQQGALFMDAPVSGGIPAAQKRAVTVMASGPDEAWDTGAPVLRALSTKVLRCGTRVGDGQALKLITNGIGACYRLATLEIVALGRRLGLPFGAIVSALNDGDAANFTTRNMLVGLLEGRATTNFAMGLMVKDLDGDLSLGAQAGIAMPLTGTARGLMQSTLGLFGPEARLEDVVPLVEKLCAVRIAGATAADAATHPSGIMADDLLVTLCRAVRASNMVAVLEGTEAGLKFGLDIRRVGEVIEAGSAWCGIAGPLLAALAKAPLRLADYAAENAALETAASLAAAAGMPFILPGIVLARFRAASSWSGIGPMVTDH